MTQPVPLLVFSDLDGTLLDHDTYSWAPARPALAVLRKSGAGVILASSKTAAEIAILQRDLGLQDWPAIVENGAGVLGGDEAEEYTRIRTILSGAPGRDHYTGFGDMSAAEVAKSTGLTLDDADRAKARVFSEPGLWSGTDAEKRAFLAYLNQHGLGAREGGRYLTISSGKTKADQMAAIIENYGPQHTIALGDAPNDVEMLQAADHGVIVANPHRTALPALPQEATGQITRTTLSGPAGWNAAVLALLDQLNISESGRTHG